MASSAALSSRFCAFLGAIVSRLLFASQSNILLFGSISFILLNQKLWESGMKRPKEVGRTVVVRCRLDVQELPHTDCQLQAAKRHPSSAAVLWGGFQEAKCQCLAGQRVQKDLPMKRVMQMRME